MNESSVPWTELFVASNTLKVLIRLNSHFDRLLAIVDAVDVDDGEVVDGKKSFVVGT